MAKLQNILCYNNVRGRGIGFPDCSPYAISIDHITCTPTRPTVIAGKRAQGGPRTLATPAHCAEPSDAASSAVGRALKPVMLSLQRNVELLSPVGLRCAGTDAGS